MQWQSSRSGSRRKLVACYVSFNSTNLDRIRLRFTAASLPLPPPFEEVIRPDVWSRICLDICSYFIRIPGEEYCQKKEDSAKTQFPKFNEMQTRQKEGATATVVSPGQILPVLRTANSSSSSSSNSALVFSLEPMIWGLIPSYVKNPSGAANEHFKVIYLWNLILMPMQRIAINYL